MEGERGWSDDLIEAHGRPCYPIELAPEIYKDPGPYKDIMSYWHDGPWSTPIGMQLQRWNMFRLFQLRVRDYFVRHNRSPELQQRAIDRRRRHGLDGDVRLLEDRDKQSDLDHWMEYQDYELQECELFEKNLEKAEADLVARQKATAEARLTPYEHRCEGTQALAIRRSAKQKLELAESRLKAAELDAMGDTVRRETWVRWFQEQIDAAQAQLDAVPKYRKKDWLPGGK